MTTVMRTSFCIEDIPGLSLAYRWLAILMVLGDNRY
jgi:hypothetical protein